MEGWDGGNGVIYLTSLIYERLVEAGSIEEAINISTQNLIESLADDTITLVAVEMED